MRVDALKVVYKAATAEASPAPIQHRAAAIRAPHNIPAVLWAVPAIRLDFEGSSERELDVTRPVVDDGLFHTRSLSRIAALSHMCPL